MRKWASYALVLAAGCAVGWGSRSVMDACERRAVAAQEATALKRMRDDASCVLSVRGSTENVVPIFAGADAARELFEAAQRGESAATLATIMKSAEGFTVPRGTRCSLVTAYNFGRGVRQVRILDGEHSGQSGFVLDAWRRLE